MNLEKGQGGRPIPLLLILLLVAAVHGPLLLMQLPAKVSYDTNFHIFLHLTTLITGLVHGTRNGSRVFLRPRIRRSDIS